MSARLTQAQADELVLAFADTVVDVTYAIRAHCDAHGVDSDWTDAPAVVTARAARDAARQRLVDALVWGAP